jgi:hypothetical protein
VPGFDCLILLGWFPGKANNKSLVPTLPVKLDNGSIVQARVDGYVTLVPGSRAVFVEIATPLFGFKRYRFNRRLERDLAKPGAPLNVVSP